MKLYCNVSGIHWEATTGFESHTLTNPAIFTPIHKLTPLLDFFWNQHKTAKGNLDYTPTRYLYLLAWFANLPEVTFRDTCEPSKDYPILLANAERLISVVNLTQRNKHIQYPSLIVSTNSTIADCLPHWLDAVTSAYADHLMDRVTSPTDHQLQEITQTLELVRSLDSARVASRNAKLVAQWASVAGGFPKSTASLWEDIIIAAMKQLPTVLVSNKVTRADIDELVEHCEGNLPHGSYHAHALMKALRDAQELLTQVHAASLKVAASTNTTNLVARGPEPKRAQYASQADYLRARIAWRRGEPMEAPATLSTEDIANLLGI